MPRVRWPLHHGRPSLQIVVRSNLTGPESARTLLADSGAGTSSSGLYLLLEEEDCLLYGHPVSQEVTLRGAYNGTFPVYAVRVIVPELQLQVKLPVVGVPSV